MHFSIEIKYNKLEIMNRLYAKLRKVFREKGGAYLFKAVVRESVNWLKYSLQYPYYRFIAPKKFFTLNGKQYQYLYHRYNATWRSERAVEIPVVWEIVRQGQNQGKEILEIGNVLSHYFQVSHDILDKYELARGVINQDVVSFRPAKKYDLIISISTLEHVGWDEDPKDPKKILPAFKNLINLLSDHGKIVVTIPIGYNKPLDKLLLHKKIKFSQRFCLKKISRDNQWVETRWSDISNSKYGHPFKGTNGLLIGILPK